MNAFARHFEHAYDFPARQAPQWAFAVDRWPQLDAYAYGLPELFQHAKSELPASARPDLVMLASPESSNHTDLAFVQTGAASPAKFVHTLPNSRSAALLQVMRWSGPLLCLQDDPQTVSEALFEAASFAHGEAQRVWLFSIERSGEQTFKAHLFDITQLAPLVTHWSLNSRAPGKGATDRDLFAQLQNPSLSPEIVLSNGLQMTFKDLARG